MATKKITQLTELTEVADDDYLAVVDTSQTVTKKIRKDNLFAGLLPTGAIMQYAGTSEPDGWLLCNGQAVDRTVYAALFAEIGTTYGSGDGSTTFNVPDMSGRVPVGVKASDAAFNELGETGGAKTHTLTYQEMPQHNHPIIQSPHSHGVSDPGHSHNLRGYNGAYPGGSGAAEDGSGVEWTRLFDTRGGGVTPSGTGIGIHGANANISTGLQGDNQPHNNLQPYLVLNFIIKV